MAISNENRRFSHLVYLTPPLREFTLEFCNGGTAEKIRVMPIPEKERV